MKYLEAENFLGLTNSREFFSEKEMMLHLIEELPQLLRIDPVQLQNEVVTTGFKNQKSQIADLVVYSRFEDKVRHPLLIIEIKLDKTINEFSDKTSYEKGFRQLSQYCQDLGSPYGVLLSDTKCLIGRFNLKNQCKMINKLPYPNQIEKEVTYRLFKNFIFREGSWWYFLVITVIVYFLSYISTLLTRRE